MARYTLSTENVTTNSATIVVTLSELLLTATEITISVAPSDNVIKKGYNLTTTLPAGAVGATTRVSATNLRSDCLYTALSFMPGTSAELASTHFTTLVDSTPKTATVSQWENMVDRLLFPENYFINMEIKTLGTWKGEPSDPGPAIYKKIVSARYLTPGADHAVGHGIKNLGQVLYVTGMLKTSGGTFYMLPRASANGSSQNVEVWVDSTNVHFHTGADASFDSATATIYYTKTS